jgi:dihydrofolate reductase
MGRLMYTLNVSLDGFVETQDRSLDWGVVDDELHTWFNDHTRQVDASLYGRGLYETMAAYWPTAASDPAATGPMREFAVTWAQTPRYVFSTTLEAVEHNSQLVRAGDIGEALDHIRAEHAGTLEVGGARLAHEFVKRGLVDEYWMVVHPVVLGAGTPYFPPGSPPQALELIETRTFASGVVLLAYRRSGGRESAGSRTTTAVSPGRRLA